MTTLDFFDASVLRECVEWTKNITREAGKIVKEGFYMKNVTVDHKLGLYDVVTEFDQRTENFLIAAIKEKYPGHL